jgi:acyl carrier protein
MSNLTTTIKGNWQKWLFWLGVALLMGLLSACGGQPEEVAMSEQVPARRGDAEILVEVRDITADVLEVPFADVAEDSDFRQDLGADEESMASLAEEFESIYEIELTEAEVEALTTVGSAVELIVSKQ